MGLIGIRLSEISQREKNTNKYNLSYVWDLKKSQTYRNGVGAEVGGNGEILVKGCKLPARG